MTWRRRRRWIDGGTRVRHFKRRNGGEKKNHKKKYISRAHTQGEGEDVLCDYRRKMKSARQPKQFNNNLFAMPKRRRLCFEFMPINQKIFFKKRKKRERYFNKTKLACYLWKLQWRVQKGDSDHYRVREDRKIEREHKNRQKWLI